METRFLSGIVEADERFACGKESNKHESKKLKKGRGSVGKQPVLGLRQREWAVTAVPIPTNDANSIEHEIFQHVMHGSTIYSDEHKAYSGLDGIFFKHESVNHSLK